MNRWRAKRIQRAGLTVECHAVGEELQRFLDGDIDADTASRIEAHLEHCLRCGLEIATYRRIKATLEAQRPDVPLESIERLREFGRRLARGEHPAEQWAALVTGQRRLPE